MTPPPSIPFSLVDLIDRGRKTYNAIDELAQSIEDNGLCQPLVLAPHGEGRYRVVMGGRRWHALTLLGTDELFHGSTCTPDRPGFLFYDEDDDLLLLQKEIAENLDRDDMFWKDELRLIVKAYRIAKERADLDAQTLTMRHYGAMIGVPYAELQAANYIFEDVESNPDRYKDVTSIRQAMSVLLKVNANALAKFAAERELTVVPALTQDGVKVVKPEGLPEVLAQNEPKLSPAVGLSTQFGTADAVPHEIIPLSTQFLCVNSLDWMEAASPEIFDHIVCDPDYAVDVDLLNSGTGTSPGIIAAGVRQRTVEDSLADLYRFLRLAFKVVRPGGFCVFFYDIQHHEKLQNAAIAAGWQTQRWPLTWRKIDYRSNASPSKNTCKNCEWAMMVRKPDAILVKAQMSSVFDCATGKITKELGHAFAKPVEVWKWIYSMIALKGQIVFDPFCGSGSASIAALQWGLRPVGCELDEGIYFNLMSNLQLHYRKVLGDAITFR